MIAAKAGHALHVLDRFHITAHLNQAVDEVRRAESGRLRGRPLAEKLKKMRWKLLRKGSRVRGRAGRRLCGLLQSKLATGRALDAQGNLPRLLALPLADLGGGFWTSGRPAPCAAASNR